MFMKDLLSKRQQSRAVAKEGKCWYLTHPGIYKARRPGNICAVFDLCAEFKGASIYKALLSGPDLTNQLVGVLLQFREEQVAASGDTEAVFHQVKTPEDHRKFLRFLWWKNSNPTQEILDHEMTSHVFGGISSP